MRNGIRTGNGSARMRCYSQCALHDIWRSCSKLLVTCRAPNKNEGHFLTQADDDPKLVGLGAPETRASVCSPHCKPRGFRACFSPGRAGSCLSNGLRADAVEGDDGKMTVDRGFARRWIQKQFNISSLPLRASLLFRSGPGGATLVRQHPDSGSSVVSISCCRPSQ